MNSNVRTWIPKGSSGEMDGPCDSTFLVLVSRLLNSIAKKAAETKLLEINKRKKEWRGFSSKAAASSTPVEAGEEDVLDEDGEEEWEVSWLAI